MKIFFIVLVILGATQAHAWNKILNCNNGDLVVDQGDNDLMGRPKYQLVLRGQPLNHFVQSGAVKTKDINSNGEFIIEVGYYDGALMGYINSGDHHQPPFTYRSYWISRHYSDVQIRATYGGRIGAEREVANWQFHSCR